jgi:hypothetical protein
LWDALNRLRTRRHASESGQLKFNSRRLALALLLGLLLLSTSILAAQGEHDPSHRYFVAGYVTTEDGSPGCGVVIQIRDRRVTTDYRGWYRIQLHMHDETVNAVNNDVGATLQVQVVGTSLVKTTTAQHSQLEDGWGESRVDFEVPSELSDPCISPLVLAGTYVGIPLAVIAGGVVAYIKVVKPWWLQRATPPSLSMLPGIGKGRLRELRAMGIETVGQLAEAAPSEIVRRTSISKKEAKRLVRRAREKLGE